MSQFPGIHRNYQTRRDALWKDITSVFLVHTVCEQAFIFLISQLIEASEIVARGRDEDRLSLGEPVFVSPAGHGFRRFYELAYKEYERLLADGVHEEDARYVLPQGVASRLVVTMNARELRHFFELRCCLRAQFEIRALAWLMLAKAKAVAPLLFENAGPVCLQGMECPERSFACHLKTKGKGGKSE